MNATIADDATGKLVTAAHVALALSCSEKQVLRLARDRKIPSVKFGRRSVRFNLSRVLEALETGAKGG